VIRVITVVWNDVKGLNRTYNSLLKQDSKLFSWIVVDGGSNDGTVEFLTELAPNFDFRFLSERDSGIYNAMNKGIEMLPEGDDFVVFMNAGDEFYEPKTLNFVNEELVNNPGSTLLYGSALNIFPDCREAYRGARSVERIKMGMPTSHQSMYYSSRYLKANYYDETYRYGGDYEHLLKLYRTSKESVHAVDKVLSKFYMDGVSEKARLCALKENYRARRESLMMSLPEAIALYILHYAHTVLKKFFPRFLSLIRSWS
jgi:putative colanic acid biosynthesis glycosyltransferase